MKEALEAIAAFPDMEPMYAYLEKRGLSVVREMPPYLIMAKVAMNAVAENEVPLST